MDFIVKSLCQKNQIFSQKPKKKNIIFAITILFIIRVKISQILLQKKITLNVTASSRNEIKGYLRVIL